MRTLMTTNDINSLNGDNLDYGMHEAQTLADTKCNFNDTFETEDNFTSLWQQSTESKCENDDEFSEEVNKMFINKNGQGRDGRITTKPQHQQFEW